MSPTSMIVHTFLLLSEMNLKQEINKLTGVIFFIIIEIKASKSVVKFSVLLEMFYLVVASLHNSLFYYHYLLLFGIVYDLLGCLNKCISIDI